MDLCRFVVSQVRRKDKDAPNLGYFGMGLASAQLDGVVRLDGKLPVCAGGHA